MKEFDVRNQSGDEDQINRSVAHNLIGEVQLPASGVACLREVQRAHGLHPLLLAHIYRIAVSVQGRAAPLIAETASTSRESGAFFSGSTTICANGRQVSSRSRRGFAEGALWNGEAASERPSISSMPSPGRDLPSKLR